MPKAHRRSVIVDLPLPRSRHAPPLLQATDIVRVASCDARGVVLDLSPLGLGPTSARSLVDPRGLLAGDEVAISFVRGDRARPLVLGRVHAPGAPARDVRINGKRVAIEAEVELELRCASATIVIRRDGRVTVDGERIVSQARGSNRVRGGSVELN